MGNYEINKRFSILVSERNTGPTNMMAWNDPLNFWAIGPVHTVDTLFVKQLIEC